MPIIYGAHKDSDETRRLVHGYVTGVKARKKGRYEAIVSLMPDSGERVLDFGCGWGYYSVAAAEKGNRVVGIDYSRNEVDICRAVWGNRTDLELRFEYSTIDEFGDREFDCVISSSVLEHVHNPGLYLSSINRVLPTGGQLILSLPNAMTPRHARAAFSRNHEAAVKLHSRRMLDEYTKTHIHINAWDAYHVTTLCATVGFEVESLKTAEGVSFPKSRYWNSAPGALDGFSHIMVFSLRKVADRVIESHA